MQLIELLSQNPIFANLSSQDQESLAKSAITRNYQKGEWISHLGDVWPYIFVVEEGCVTPLKESSERSLIVVELGVGEVFWGLSFFLEAALMPVALVAKDVCRISMWPIDHIKPLLLKNGQMSWELTRLMVQRMQYASDILDEFAFQPVTGRLARLLLEHFDDAVGDYVARDMTLDEMAARIGTTREMVCRQLYKFADQGTIQINRTEFMISDQERLENIAGKI
ncbi:MAG: Crp/Fnr family transcriptional regulator [Anaerolineales bacterium]|nr:Crp/Fnr family transcriptional regulator [Chloroflexota bacterium]MBL6979611.1 Crp/Fnr family transcriptional regulator [Anaerolineales bacterium]